MTSEEQATRAMTEALAEMHQGHTIEAAQRVKRALLALEGTKVANKAPIVPNQKDIAAWRLEAETAIKFGVRRLGQFDWPWVVLSLIQDWEKTNTSEQHPTKLAFSRTPVADMEAEQQANEARGREGYEFGAQCLAVEHGTKVTKWDQLATEVRRKWILLANPHISPYAL